MRRRPVNEEGKRIRSPSAKANYWGKTGRAYLNTVFRGFEGYRIITVTDANTPGANILISDSDSKGDSRPVEGRRSLNWLLERYEGQDEGLKDVVGAELQIYGRDPQSPDSQPNGDTLYLGGGVEIIGAHEDIGRFNIGKVFGLEIVTQNITAIVWPIGDVKTGIVGE